MVVSVLLAMLYGCVGDGGGSSGSGGDSHGSGGVMMYCNLVS